MPLPSPRPCPAQTNVPSQSHSTRFVLVFGCIAKGCGATARSWKALRVVVTDPSVAAQGVGQAAAAEVAPTAASSAVPKRPSHRPLPVAAPSSPRGASGRRLPPPRVAAQVRSLEASKLAWGAKGGASGALSSRSDSDSDSDGSFDFDDMDAALVAAEAGPSKGSEKELGGAKEAEKLGAGAAGGDGTESATDASKANADAGMLLEDHAGTVAGAGAGGSVDDVATESGAGSSVGDVATGARASEGDVSASLSAAKDRSSSVDPSTSAPHLVGFYLYAEPDRMAPPSGARLEALEGATAPSPRAASLPLPAASSDDEPEAWQGEAWEPDTVLTGAADAAFLRFSKALATCPDACARHGGDAELWPVEEAKSGEDKSESGERQGRGKGGAEGSSSASRPAQPSSQSAPSSSGGVIVDPPAAVAWPPACPRCGGERRYECQLLAPAIAALEEAAGWVGKPGPPLAWDWLAISVATCASDCAEPSRDDLDSARRGYVIAEEAIRMAREVFQMQRKG